MKRFLLATTAIIALTAHLRLADAADIDATGNVDYPTTFISVEGGYLFNASEENAGFRDDDIKLGNLGNLQPGSGAVQGRVELGQRLNDQWDFKVGFSAIATGSDTTQGDSLIANSEFEDAIETFINTIINNTPIVDVDFSENAKAEQKTSLQIADFEVGYHTEDVGRLQTRLFAGVRGLHAKTELDFETDGAVWITLDTGEEINILPDVTKSGEISDTVYAIGPRIGADLVVPLESADVALVGSASGSLLFGSIDSETGGVGGAFDFSDAQTIWNVEAMAGLSFGIGERADLTLGYRAAQFGELMVDRSDVDKQGHFGDTGQSDLLLHGPFARLTVEIP